LEKTLRNEELDRLEVEDLEIEELQERIVPTRYAIA